MWLDIFDDRYGFAASQMAVRAVLHPVSCQQGVSNRTLRAMQDRTARPLDLPADLMRCGWGEAP
jgi:hypothetical protein